jgi:hypothetical protein
MSKDNGGMMRGSILRGALLTLMLTIVPGLIGASMPGVYFEQNTYQLVNDNIRVELLPRGDSYQIAKVALRYRATGELDYETVTMVNGGFKWETEINSNELPASSFEYEFVITDRFGASYLYAATEAGDLPFRFQVNQGGSDNLEQAEEVEAVVISPLDGETISDADFFGVISILGIPANFSLVRTKILIDGIDYTNDANVGERVITFAPSLPPGMHRVVVQFYGADGKPLNKLEWEFTLLRSRLAVERERSSGINGRFYVHNRYESLADGETVRDYLRGGVDFTGRALGLNYGGRFFLSSEESERYQPINIYNLFVQLNLGDYSFLRLSGIDNYPNYNKLMLKDTRIRGVAGTVKLGFLEVSGAYGNSRRAISGQAVIDTNAVGPGGVDVFNAFNYAFDREDYAARLGIGSRNSFLFGLNFYKAKDDFGSVEVEGVDGDSEFVLGGSKPRENLVVATDLSIKMFDRSVELYGIAAASLLNTDIRGGTVPFDSLLIYDEGISESDREFYDLATNFMTFNSGLVTNPGISWEAGLRWRFGNNFFQARFEDTNAEFESFGLPYVRKDYQALRISDGVTILDNSISLNAGFDRILYNKSLDDQITSNQLNLNVGYHPGPGLPGLNLNFSNIGRSNDIADTTRQIDETFRTYALSAVYNLRLLGAGHNLSATLSQTTREDANPYYAIANTLTNNLNLTVRSAFSFPLQTRLSYDLVIDETGSDATFYNQDFSAFTLGASYLFARLLLNWNLELGGYAKLGTISTDAADFGGTTADGSFNRNLYNAAVTLDMQNLGRLYSGFDYYMYKPNASYSNDFTDIIWQTRYSVNF